MENADLSRSKNIMIYLLNEITRICNENNLDYWLDSGTLLGAIRHRGFIPWDDDIDIVMPRESYEKFEKIAPKLLGEDILLQSIYTDKGYCMPWLKVRYKNSLIIEDEDDTYHRGIFVDIFPYDSYSIDKSQMQKLKFKLKIVFNLYLCASKKIRFIISDKKDSFFKKVLKGIFGCILLPLKIIPKISKGKFYLKTCEKKKWEVNGEEYMGYGMEVAIFDKVVKKDIIYPLTKVEFEGEKYYAPNNWNEYLKEYYGDYMKLPPEEERKVHACEFKFDLTKEEMEKEESKLYKIT